MRQILFNSCCPSIVCSINGVISWCNPALIRLFGLDDAAPIIGASFRALLPGSELHQFNEDILPAFSGIGWSGVICVRKLDGVQLHVHMSITPVADSDEVLIQFSPAVIDIPHPAPNGTEEFEACESNYLNALPIPIVILDETRVIRFVNDVGVDRFHSITGLLIEQDCSIYDILPEIELKEFEQCFEVALSGNRIVKELTRVDVQNRERRMSVTFCPVSIAGGQTKHVLLMVDDTTDKLRLEKKLHHKDRILASIPDAVIMLNERGFITEWPGSAQSLFGYTSKQTVDKNLSFLTTDMHDAAVREQILLPLTEDNLLTIRMQLRTKTANLLNTELSISPLVSTEGKRELVVHIRRTDTGTNEQTSPTVTSFTQTEVDEALEQSEARYKSLVENTDALVFCVGLDLVTTFIGGKPDEIAGYTIADYKKNPGLWANTLHPDDMIAVSEAVTRIIETGKAESIEFRVRRPDSQIMWMKATLSAHYEEDCAISCVDGFQTDISEQVESRERNESHVARTESLARTSRKIVGTLEFETILHNLVDGIVDGLDCSCILLKATNASGNGAEIVMHAIRMHDQQELPETVDFNVRQCAIDTGYQPAKGASVCTLAPELYELGLFHRNSPVILVPLCASLECGHIIAAWRDDPLNDFNDDDLWFAGQIATLVSSSLTTSLLYEHQVTVAQAFQRDMIPSPPSIMNCEIAVFYNPVTQGIDIGGDFCDVIELPDDKVVVVIGDVSGKGLESAVQAGQTRAMIRALVRSNPEPGAVIHSLNAGLYSYLPTDSFVTLFYCVLDTTTGSLRYVNAGHEPPMLAGSENEVRILSRSGPILGILEEAYQETHYASLINGEALLCYTDGVTDVLINDEWLGQDGLRDILSRFPNCEAESLVQTIVDVVANPENVQRKDDQLLVAVRLSAHL